MSYPKPAHFDGKYFSNLDRKITGKKNFLQFLQWQLFHERKKWPVSVENTETPSLPKKIKEDEVFITFINHATELVQFKGLSILTDPVFSERASPFQNIGPKRVRAPGLLLNQLPPLDYVVVSHNHYDHMDIPSLQEIHRLYQPQFIVPLKNKHFLHKAGIDTVIELDWWQEHQINAEQSITLTPAQHWSARGLFDRCKALWGGYLFTSYNLKIFFAGDTGYNHHFQKIRAHIGSVDVSLLPIGGYEPQWFMKDVHMNPEEAVLAHLDLGSHLSIGMHYGTFALTNEGIDDPILDLQTSLTRHQIAKEAFLTPNNGQTICYKKS